MNFIFLQSGNYLQQIFMRIILSMKTELVC